MTGRYLLLGMIAGLIAGVLAFGVGKVWGEPPVEAAIAIEEAGSATAADHSHAEMTTDAANPAEHQAAPAGHSHGDGEEELVSRSTQAGFGLLIGMMVFGAGLGGIFGLVFALVEGRFSQLSAQGTAAVMAVLGYISVVLVPQLKYPANPPAVGDGETIGLRTQFFFTMLVLSILAMLIAVAIARSGRDRWQAGIIGGIVYLALVTIAGYTLPSFSEVPTTFPGDLLWEFRTIALGIEAVLWAATGLVFGWLVQRSWAQQGRLQRI